MTQSSTKHFNKRIYTPTILLRDLRGIAAHFDRFGGRRGHRVIGSAFTERIMLAVTAVNRCRYCSYGHARRALQCGLSGEEIDLLLRGDVGHAPPEEVPALLFAQHYAETGGDFDPDMIDTLMSTYGREMARAILVRIRMITIGNLAGNTFDALLSRLQGNPAANSDLVDEVASLALVGVGMPVAVLGGLLGGLNRPPKLRSEEEPVAEPMKVLVYGAGVLGSFYAAGLHEGGHDVTVLARGQRLRDIRDHGLVLEDPKSGVQITSRVRVAEELKPDDAYDLVLVIMRANQVAGVLPSLAANQSTPSVVFVGNNAAGPDQMVAALGRERVLLGFGGTGGVRTGHVIRLIPGTEFGNSPMMVGELSGEITPRLKRIAAAFAGAGMKIRLSTDAEAYLKTHVALVSPIVNALYMAGGDNYRLARTRDAVVLCVRAIREGFRVLRALRTPITPPILRALEWVPEPVLVVLLRRLSDTYIAEIGVAGHANAARDEFKKLADDFGVLARSASVPTPAIDKLCGYIDPETPPTVDGSAHIPMNWRGVWAGLGALAALALLAGRLRSRRH